MTLLCINSLFEAVYIYYILKGSFLFFFSLNIIAVIQQHTQTLKLTKISFVIRTKHTVHKFFFLSVALLVIGLDAEA